MRVLIHSRRRLLMKQKLIAQIGFCHDLFCPMDSWCSHSALGELYIIMSGLKKTNGVSYCSKRVPQFESEVRRAFCLPRQRSHGLMLARAQTLWVLSPSSGCRLAPCVWWLRTHVCGANITQGAVLAPCVEEA